MYCTGFWLVSLLRTMTLSLAVGSSLMPPESNRDFTLPWVGSAGPGPHRAQVPSKPAETGLRSIARRVRRISSRRRWSTQAGKPAKTLQDDCGDQSTGGHDVCPLLADSTHSRPRCERQQSLQSGQPDQTRHTFILFTPFKEAQATPPTRQVPAPSTAPPPRASPSLARSRSHG
jgi:hypothetical protein